MVNCMNFERLYFLREEKDLTQEDLAKILKVNRVAISQWETGKEVISLIKLNEYANYFNVSMDYIVGLTNVKNYKYVNKDIDKKLVGKRLLYTRKEQHLTQENVAKLVNTTHSTISAYESGKTLILTTFAYQFCHEYSISLDWLCGRID